MQPRRPIDILFALALELESVVVYYLLGGLYFTKICSMLM
jgi:predicted methyltransferase